VSGDMKEDPPNDVENPLQGRGRSFNRCCWSKVPEEENHTTHSRARGVLEQAPGPDK
jgi:hypothetical protein